MDTGLFLIWAFLIGGSVTTSGEPVPSEIEVDKSFGIAGLADINALAVFSADSTHLFVVTQRRIQVFRCADGKLISTVRLPIIDPNPIQGLLGGLRLHSKALTTVANSPKATKT